MHIARQRRPQLGIDMSPLIDCVFQLLIFFMLSSSFLTPSIRLELPQAATADPAETQDIFVSADPLGRLFLNNQLVTEQRLEAELRAVLVRSKHRIVTFRGDEKTPYELVMKVVDSARAAGATHVNLAHKARP